MKKTIAILIITLFFISICSFSVLAKPSLAKNHIFRYAQPIDNALFNPNDADQDHDLSIESIYIRTRNPEYEEPVRVRVLVINHETEAEDVQLRVSLGSINEDIITTIPYLAENQRSYIWLSPIYSETGPFTITATIDANDQYEETNEENNIATRNLIITGPNLAPEITPPIEIAAFNEDEQSQAINLLEHLYDANTEQEHEWNVINEQHVLQVNTEDPTNIIIIADTENHPDWNGEETITFTVRDNGEEPLETTQEVRITVMPVNDAPVCEIPEDEIPLLVEEDNEIIIDPNDYCHDVDNEALEYSIESGPEDIIEIQLEGRIIHIRFQENYFGDEPYIIITASDGRLESEPLRIPIRVTPVNDPPNIENCPDEAINEDTVDNEISINLWECSSDIDNDYEELTYTLEQDNQELINCEINENQYIVCDDPAENANGINQIIVNISDPDELSDEDDITITVRPINDAPTCNIPNLETREDTPLENIDLNEYCEDIDDDDLSYSVIGENENIECILNENTLDIIPDNNWHGSTSCTIEADDNNGGTAQDSFNIEVEPVNDEPEIDRFTAEPREILERETITLRAEFHDIDRELNEDELLTIYIYEEANEEACLEEPNEENCACFAENQDDREEECEIQLNEPGQYRYRATVIDREEASDRSARRTVTVNEIYTVSGVITQLFGVPENEEDYDSLDEENPIEGATIVIETLEGEEVGNAETNGDGEYSIDLEEEGQYRMLINADGFHEGIRYIEVEEDMNYDTNIAPDDFNIGLFNLICRQMNGGIQHWLEQPEYQVWIGGIINIREEVDWDRQPTQEQIDLAHSVIGDEDQLHWISNGFINEPEINDIEEEPRWRDRPEGVIYVVWSAGGGAHGEDVIDDEIISAISFVGTRSPAAVYRQEIAQTLGFRNDNDDPDRFEDILSIFNDAPLDRPSNFQLIDAFLGKFLFTRPLSSRTPDVDPEPAEERIQRDELGRRIHTLTISYTDINGEVTEQSFEIIEGEGWTKLNLHPILKKQYYRLGDNEDLYFNYDAPKGKRFKTQKTKEYKKKTVQNSIIHSSFKDELIKNFN